MAIRTSQATWKGNLREGNGTLKVGTAFEGSYSFASRFEEGTGTNPEELIAAAHASCFSMALSNGLDQAGFTPERVDTTAKVHLTKTDAGFGITKIELHTEAAVPDIDEDTFQEQANDAKKNCPISKVLAATEITLNAKLVS
jgi:osmotically inducible protein OsmC